jgi:hypothetical protein
MVCKNICEMWPSPGKTGYYMGIKYCSKCNRFVYSEGVFCLCCKANLRTGPYDRKAKEKRKTNII